LSDHLVSQTDSAYERLLAQEALILDATELISELMEARGLSRAELAKRIGKARGFVTQVLSGSRNMTLRTFADLAYALDARVTVQALPIASLYGQSFAGQTATARVAWQSLLDFYSGGRASAQAPSTAYQIGHLLFALSSSTVVPKSMLSAWATAGLLPQINPGSTYAAASRPNLKVVQGSKAA
jgi:transcriptional regulator with XRE-family HTH domain